MTSEGTADGIGTWLGRRADRPVVAAGLVGTSAVVFSALWSVAFFALFSTEPWGVSDLLYQQLFTVLAVGNAILVSGTVWAVAVARSDAPLTAKRGALVGMCIGFVSYLTLGVLLATLILFRTGQFEGPLHALSLAFRFGLAAILFTLGIPVGLSTGIGWYLGRVRERATSRG